MKKLYQVDQMNPEAQIIERAANTFKQQGVVIMPTDSVYGIGCMASKNNPAYPKIFSIKQRPSKQTLPWLIADVDELFEYGKNISDTTRALAETFWPGALTLIVSAADTIAQEYVGPNNTIALRMPNSELVRQVERAVGCPLATTSANLHGQPSGIQVSDFASSMLEEVDLVLDGNCTPLAIASTIVDCTSENYTIVRVGAIAPEAIEAVVKE